MHSIQVIDALIVSSVTFYYQDALAVMKFHMIAMCMFKSACTSILYSHWCNTNEYIYNICTQIYILTHVKVIIQIAFSVSTRSCSVQNWLAVPLSSQLILIYSENSSSSEFSVVPGPRDVPRTCINYWVVVVSVVIGIFVLLVFIIICAFVS